MGISTFPQPASGPTLSEITSAITTNAAPATVTNSSIASAVSANAPSPFGWTLVSSVSPAYSASSFTFSGLSGYKSYRLVVPYLSISGGNGVMQLRLNGDSGSVYQYNGVCYSGTVVSTFAGNATNYQLNNGSNAGNFQGVIEIHNCNVAGSKYIKAECANTYAVDVSSGSYRTSSTITSITLLNSNAAGTLGNGNTVYLYGAN